MIQSYLLSASIILFISSVSMLVFLIHRIRVYERRLSQIEMMVVRSVLEESPAIIDLVVKTHSRLRNEGGLRPELALEAARRLCGLEP